MVGGVASSRRTIAERETGSTSQSTVDPGSRPSTVRTPSGTVDFNDGKPGVTRDALDRRISPTPDQLDKLHDKRFGQPEVLRLGQKIKKGRNLCPTNRTNMGDLFPGEDEQHARALELLAKYPDAVTQISEREWRARSASGRGYYRLSRTRKSWMCECPSAASVAPARCKHAIAVIISRYPEDLLTRSLDREKPAKSWKKRRWPEYNQSLRMESVLFDRLLWALCREIPEPLSYPGKVGRRPIPSRLQAFIAVKKAGLKKGALRAYSDMDALYGDGKGILPRGVPNEAVSSRFFNNPRAIQLLSELIQDSAAPLRDLEEKQTVAIDSSGFMLANRGWYRKIAHKEPIGDPGFVKGHVIVGCRTKIILAAIATPRRKGGDSPRFEPLLAAVHENGFHPAVVAADGAYNSRDSAQFAANLGIQPVIPFADGMTGRPMGRPAYRKMWLLFELHRQEFDRLYHQRSLVESVFSSVKKRVGEVILSRNPEAQLAELLAKFVNHNVCVLVRALYEFGLDLAKLELPDLFDGLGSAKGAS